MAFRKFGGLEYNKTNNYVSSNTVNNMKLNISDHIGKLNTKIVVDSHLDLNNQSMFNVGNIYFSNGSDLQSLSDNLDLLSNNNTWTGLNTFTKSTNFRDILSSSAKITGLATITSVVASSIISEDLSSTTAKFNTISSKQGNLICNSNIDLSNNSILGLSRISGIGGIINCDSLNMGGNNISGLSRISASGTSVICDALNLNGNGISNLTSIGAYTTSINCASLNMGGNSISNISSISGNGVAIGCNGLNMSGAIDMNYNLINHITSITLGATGASTTLASSTINVGTTLPSFSIGEAGNTGNINYGGVSKSCYSSNLSSALLSEKGLYFGRNLGGSNEFNVVALSESNGATGPNNQQMMGIYTSTENIYGVGNTGATGATGTELAISLSQNYIPTSIGTPSYPGFINNLTTINGAVRCGQANYGYETITNNGIYFCRNLTGGNNEYDIVGVNSYQPGNDYSVLNVYTSRSGVTGTHGRDTGYVVGTLPLVSMNETTVAINGNMGASQVQCSSIAQSSILTLGVTGTTDLVISSPTSITITSPPTTPPIIVQSEQLFDISSNATITFSFPSEICNIKIGTDDFYIITSPTSNNYTIYYEGQTGPTSTYTTAQPMAIVFYDNNVTFTGTPSFPYSSTTSQKFICVVTSSTLYPFYITNIGGYQGDFQSTGATGQVITANGLGGWSWQNGGSTGVLGITGSNNITVSEGTTGNYSIDATGLALLTTGNTFQGTQTFEYASADSYTINGSTASATLNFYSPNILSLKMDDTSTFLIQGTTGTTGNSDINYMFIGSTGVVCNRDLYMNDYLIQNCKSLKIGGGGETAGTYTELILGGATFGINNTLLASELPQISIAVNNSLTNTLQGLTVTNSGIDISNYTPLNVSSITNNIIPSTGATGQVITANGTGGWNWENGGSYIKKMSGFLGNFTIGNAIGALAVGNGVYSPNNCQLSYGIYVVLSNFSGNENSIYIFSPNNLNNIPTGNIPFASAITYISTTNGNTNVLLCLASSTNTAAGTYDLYGSIIAINV